MKIKITILTLALLNIFLIFITLIEVKKNKLLTDESTKKENLTKNLLESYSMLADIEMNEDLVVYKHDSDSIRIIDLCEKSGSLIFIHQDNCTQCILELRNLNNGDFKYIVSYRDKVWAKWLIGSVLNDRNAFYVKEYWFDGFNSHNPLLLKFDEYKIDQVVPINYKSSRLVFDYLLNSDR